MAKTNDFSDDYVASILAKDADAAHNRYIKSGLGSLLGGRPQSAAPKPNTRFLRNIIRETDSHNAALLAREAEESKAKLRELRRERDRQNARLEPTVYYAGTKHNEGDAPSAKRRRSDEVDVHHRRAKKCKDGDNPKRWSSLLNGLGERKERRGRKQDGLYQSVDEKKHEVTRWHNVTRPQKRSVQRSSATETEVRSRSKSPILSDVPSDNGRNNIVVGRGRSPRQDESHHMPRRREHSVSIESGTVHSKLSTRHANRKRRRSRSIKSSRSGSDPLESIVGPVPPPPASKLRIKGRGAATAASAMNVRFAADYDPKADVLVDPSEEDDWDMALEALRDRQKWRAQGADRLKAAGFTEDEVRKWEKGGEKDESDVQWRKEGEGREWDRGKIVNDMGDVDVQPEWGRLKGS